MLGKDFLSSSRTPFSVGAVPCSTNSTRIDRYAGNGSLCRRVYSKAIARNSIERTGTCNEERVASFPHISKLVLDHSAGRFTEPIARNRMGKEQDALLLSSLQVASKNWIGFDWITKAQSWDAASSQNKEAREQSVAARKQLAETTKQFKRSVKSVEQAGSNLGSANTEENVLSTVKAIETLARNCRLTVKAYQGEH